jgi:fatty acid desaturase
MTSPSIKPAPLEWPTWCVVFAIYGGWILTITFYTQLPVWFSHPVLIFVTAWFMSLQHEVLHGHPTPWRGFNRALVLFPISPWFPYDLYRDSHLAHHQDANLTLPGIDPESNFVTREAYAQLPRYRQRWLSFQRTLTGRLLVFSGLSAWHVWSNSMADILKGDRRYLGTWTIHLSLLAVLLYWVDRQAEMSPWVWLLGLAYPALALIVLRSFFEHRAAPLPEHRIVINEANVFWRLFYLNNNFHAVHHEQPSLSWYRIPKAYQSDRLGYLERNGGFLIHGYASLFRRFLFKPVDTPAHPFASSNSTHEPEDYKP